MSPILFQALQNRIHSRYTKHNTFKSDVFSFGLCFLFAATLTYNSLISIREIFDSIKIQMILSKFLNKYSNKFNSILFKMLEIDEKNRPDFIELEKIIENNS
jgi:serine/threonine protein kinase